MDGGTFYDNGLYKKVLTLAKEHGIKVQTKTKIAGGTDGAKIQRTGKGAIHSPFVRTVNQLCKLGDNYA